MTQPVIEEEDVTLRPEDMLELTPMGGAGAGSEISREDEVSRSRRSEFVVLLPVSVATLRMRIERDVARDDVFLGLDGDAVPDLSNVRQGTVYVFIFMHKIECVLCIDQRTFLVHCSFGAFRRPDESAGVEGGGATCWRPTCFSVGPRYVHTNYRSFVRPVLLSMQTQPFHRKFERNSCISVAYR